VVSPGPSPQPAASVLSERPQARQARSSRVYPAPSLVTPSARLDGAAGNGAKALALRCAGRPLPLDGAGPWEHPGPLAGRLARLAPMTPQSPVFLKPGPAVAHGAYPGDRDWLPVQVILPGAHLHAYQSMIVIVLIDPGIVANFRLYLLTSRYLRGRPDPFRTVRDLGRIPARCSWPSGIPEGRSPRWLPARLPVAEDLADRIACCGPSAFQAGHIPSWRRSCESHALSPVAAGRRWLLLLLSATIGALVLLTATGNATGAGTVGCPAQTPARARKSAPAEPFRPAGQARETSRLDVD
jgi:hypothetical protein